MSPRDLARLERLGAERGGTISDAGYRIGPDDLLDVRIPDLFAVKPAAFPPKPSLAGASVPDVEPAPTFQQGLRVSAAGEVTVPYLGALHVAGLTAPELAEQLARLLEARGILHRPEVSVAIAEHRSHVVAVIGSVQRPGLYPLTRPGATIADLIWAAGGPTKDAGRLVQFAVGQGNLQSFAVAQPAAGRDPLDGRVAANAVRVPGTETLSDSGAPVTEGGGVGGGTVQLGATAIRIDLDALLSPPDDLARTFNVPARPGDVISIAPAGSVLIDGWVYKPGSYAITRSLTLSGAVAAAGGSMYPAKLTQATVRRVLRPGEERLYLVDLEAVAVGEAPDPAILDGDVIAIPSNGWKLVPWGLWTLVNSLLRFGASVPIA